MALWKAFSVILLSSSALAYRLPDWQSSAGEAEWPIAFFAKAPNYQPTENLEYGTSLMLGRVNRPGVETSWFVYLTNIDDGARRAVCRPMDDSKPRISSWGQFNDNGNNDAGIVLNACLEGLNAMLVEAGKGASTKDWKLDIPYTSYGTVPTNPRYYVGTKILIRHPITLRTMDAPSSPSDQTSCYSLSGANVGKVSPAVPCVVLAAKPCSNCGNPSQFGDTRFNSVDKGEALQDGFITIGRSGRELSDVNLQALILDGNRNNRNPYGHCLYNKYNGTNNLTIWQCRNCSLINVASVNALCGASVLADMVGGKIQWSAIQDSGSSQSGCYPYPGKVDPVCDFERADGLTFLAAKNVEVAGNLLKDATDGNSVFSGNGLYYHHNLILVTSQGSQHSGFNFNMQGGSRFPDSEVHRGDFFGMTVAYNSIQSQYRATTDAGHFQGARVGIELGSDPWHVGISTFDQTRFYYNPMSGVVWGYDLAGVGKSILDPVSSPSGMPWLCNGDLGADKSCVYRPLIALTSEAAPTDMLGKALLNHCHLSTFDYFYNGFGQPSRYLSDWNHKMDPDCNKRPGDY